MTLPAIKERVNRMISGGVQTDETLLDPLYVYSVINTSRASVLRADFIKNRRWSNEAQQRFYPEYSEDFQDSVCYTKFTFPTGFIQGTGAQDGLIYFGGGGEMMRNMIFRRIKSRTELSSFLSSPIMTPANGRYVGVLIEGLEALIVSKGRIKTPMVIGVFDDPTLIPTYNIDKDNYPVSNDMITDIETFAFKSLLALEISRKPDTISDSRVTPQLK